MDLLFRKKELFKATFLQHASNTTDLGDQIQEFSSVLHTLDLLRGELLEARIAKERGIGAVKRAGESFLSKEVVNALKNIPIEELNREKRRIRVKALRNSGFSNMADLLSTSTYQISSIHGISEDAAYTIKLLVKQFAEKVQKESKIKLSIDNQTKEATNLVLAVCEYRRLLNALSEIDSFEEKSKKTVFMNAKHVENVKNGALWLFFSNDEKAEVIQSWKTLKTQVEGDYAKEVHRLSALMKRTNYISKEDAWNDFAENDIAYFNILEEIMPRLLRNGDNLYASKSVVSVVERERTPQVSCPLIVSIDPIETLLKSKNTNYAFEMEMTYAELVQHLLEKYGRAKGDYFLTDGCRSKNKRIMRTKEGLICHHIDEDKAIMLCNDQFAKNNPFAYQKANRLVYCNILEHFLLHIKIAEEPRNQKANKKELPGIGGAVNLICRQINDYYNGYNFSREWQVIQMSVLEGHFEDYIKMLQHLWNVVKRNPAYLEFVNKKMICSGWYGNVVKKVYNRID